MLNLKDRIFKRKQLLERAQRFSNLFANQEFQEWKSKVVDTRLDELSRQALKGDVDSPEGLRKIARYITRYQELKFVTEGIFGVWKNTEDKIKKDLEKIKKLSESGG